MHTLFQIIGLLVRFSSKLSGGYSVRYQASNLTDRAKHRWLVLHGISSFAFGFGVTNNVLVDVVFFKERFSENLFWLIGTALVLFACSSIVIGSVITFFIERRTTKTNLPSPR